MKVEDKEQLTPQELQLIHNIIDQTRWSGEDWRKAIGPLLQKIERITNTLQTPPTPDVK